MSDREEAATRLHKTLQRLPWRDQVAIRWHLFVFSTLDICVRAFRWAERKLLGEQQ
jgi:hypothetical protein